MTEEERAEVLGYLEDDLAFHEMLARLGLGIEDVFRNPTPEWQTMLAKLKKVKNLNQYEKDFVKNVETFAKLSEKQIALITRIYNEKVN